MHLHVVGASLSVCVCRITSGAKAQQLQQQMDPCMSTSEGIDLLSFSCCYLLVTQVFVLFLILCFLLFLFSIIVVVVWWFTLSSIAIPLYLYHLICEK